MTNIIIVTCAGCGKRYKGSPGGTKYRCVYCHNTLTFPRLPRAAVSGKALCSNCWGGTDSHPGANACPTCGQKIGTREGGRAAFPGLFNNGEDPLLVNEEDEKVIHTERELTARVVAAQVAAIRERRAKSADRKSGGDEHHAAAAASPSDSQRGAAVQLAEPPKAAVQTPVTPGAAAESPALEVQPWGNEGVEEVLDGAPQALPTPEDAIRARDEALRAAEEAHQARAAACRARDEALASLRHLQAQKAAAQRELDRLRGAAPHMPESLRQDYARRMALMLAEADCLCEIVNQARDDADRQLGASEAALEALRGRLAAVSATWDERLARVLGTQPRRSAPVTVPAAAAGAPSPKRPLAAAPTGLTATAIRRGRKGARAAVPAEGCAAS